MSKKTVLIFCTALYLVTMSSCDLYKSQWINAETEQTKIPVQTSYIQATSAPIQTTTVTTTTISKKDIPRIVKPVTDDFNIDIPESHYIDAEVIYQEPELPAGCEITSLAMLLNYLGFDIDKTELCDEYLDINYDYTENFSEAYIGNPRNGSGYGCYYPVIMDTADKYLDDMESNLKIYDLSGEDFQDLFYYIAEDNPVVIWASMSLVDVNYYLAWTIDDGEEVWWYENEHCMLLTGYDFDYETVTVCDPLKGEYTYDMDRFEEIYNELEKQAITIY